MSEEKQHAILSPSGADRWMTCPGSVTLSKGIPDVPSAYSIEGTDLHEVAALCLEEGHNATDLVGQEMLSTAVFTEEHATAVQSYVDVVRSYVGSTPGAVLRVEERVPLTPFTGEPDAEGTADALVLSSEPELIVIDAKFGRGVDVPAERNRQLMMYALGALQKHELWELVKTVRIVISQPRASGTKEWICPIETLLAFKDEVLAAAKRVKEEPSTFVPSEKACKFCRAKSSCIAVASSVDATMLAGFEDLSAPQPSEGRAADAVETEDETNARLAKQMERIPMIESWIKSIRAEVERRLLNGKTIPGWKLVQGKKGSRQWDDAAVVEKLFKSMRYKQDEMYNMSLISPTAAEKLIAKVHPKRWADLQEHITQASGSLSVAPESDPRPAVKKEAPDAGFEDVSEDWRDLL